MRPIRLCITVRVDAQGSIDSTVFGLHSKVLLDPNMKQQQGIAPNQTDRLAISLWVPSIDIISFARSNGVTI